MSGKHYEKQDYEIEVLDKVMNCFEKSFEIISGICLHEKSVFQRGKRNPIVRVSPKQFLMGREVELSLVHVYITIPTM